MKSSTTENELHVPEIELRYSSNMRNSDRPKIYTSEDAYRIFIQTWDEEKINLFEQFKVILLNKALKVLGIFNLSEGGISETVVDPRLVFAAALKAGATGLIVAHNHPSGNLTASNQDKKLTWKLTEIGNLLDVPLYDHIIITSEDYLSLADEGLLEDPSKYRSGQAESQSNPDKKKETEVASSLQVSHIAPSPYQNRQKI